MKRVLVVVAVSFAVPSLAVADDVKPKPATVPVPGTVGLVYAAKPVKGGCVPGFHLVKQVRPGDDPALVAALTAPPLTGLDYSPAGRKRSERRFADWLRVTVERFGAAREAQEKVMTAANATPRARIVAVARMAVVFDHLTRLLAAVDPPRARDPLVRDAFCDQLAEIVEPVGNQAKQAREVCARKAAEAQLGPGWWDDVCKP